MSAHWSDTADWSLGADAPGEVFTVPAELREVAPSVRRPAFLRLGDVAVCTPYRDGSRIRHAGVITHGRCSMCGGGR